MLTQVEQPGNNSIMAQPGPGTSYTGYGTKATNGRIWPWEASPQDRNWPLRPRLHFRHHVKMGGDYPRAKIRVGDALLFEPSPFKILPEIALGKYPEILVESVCFFVAVTFNQAGKRSLQEKQKRYSGKNNSTGGTHFTSMTILPS